jgi:hypothetical protein
MKSQKRPGRLQLPPLLGIIIQAEDIRSESSTFEDKPNAYEKSTCFEVTPQTSSTPQSSPALKTPLAL